jgi:hypothetical protein
VITFDTSTVCGDLHGRDELGLDLPGGMRTPPPALAVRAPQAAASRPKGRSTACVAGLSILNMRDQKAAK